MIEEARSKNRDPATIASFGAEWSRFDQSELSDVERLKIFQDYFQIFPWEDLPGDAEGFDLGCGSGRWATVVAARVSRLHCIDASESALGVARANLQSHPNVEFHLASVDSIPIPESSQDFGYSLGVLHHVPDTAAALVSCTKLLKPGAPFLVYLYYAFDNRSVAYKLIWRLSDCVRRVICVLPPVLKNGITDLIALMIYLPIARLSRLFRAFGIEDKHIPLSYYKTHSFYTMRTDARDRFGTPLEQRFTQEQVRAMMEAAGLVDIRFSERQPFWCAVGRRR